MEIEYNPARKKFKFEFELSGNPEIDKRKMLLTFNKAVENYFSGRKPKSYNFLQEPERL
ncbi:MAG: hypothetical protein JNM78_07195 [Cyclobacteriaceae bacterium]|nr:hypothetical protein [Cyclobacteriaceae bacterium]